MRKIYHVELLATGKHYYFGSKRAICNTFPPEVLGVSYKYLTTINLAKNEYRGKKSIIRMGTLVTTGSVEKGGLYD